MFVNQQAVDYGSLNQQMGLPVAIGARLETVIITQDNTYTTVIPASGTFNRKNYNTQYAFSDITNNRIPVNGEYIKLVQVFVAIRATPSQPQNHDLFLQVSLMRSNDSTIIRKRMSTQVSGCLSVNFTALCEMGSYITVEVYGRNGDKFDNGEISVIGWPGQ